MSDDVSYESLQSKMGEQFKSIAEQQATLQEQRRLGAERVKALEYAQKVESLRRGDPQEMIAGWYGRKAEIKKIKDVLGGFVAGERQISGFEKELEEQKSLLESKKAEGWKIRETEGDSGGFEFYKVTQVPGTGGGGGDFSVYVHWVDYRSGRPVTKKVQTSASRLDNALSEIAGWGGSVTGVESLGGGRRYRTPEMRTTIGGNFMLWEPPKEGVVAGVGMVEDVDVVLPSQFKGQMLPTLKISAGDTLLRLTGGQKLDVSPTKSAPSYVPSSLISRMGTTATPSELELVGHYEPEKAREQYEARESEWEFGDVSPYKKLGYVHVDPDYKGIIEEQTSNITEQLLAIETIEANIELIESSPMDVMWTVTDEFGKKSSVSRDVALGQLQSDLPVFKSTLREMKSTLSDVQKYRRHGYEVDVKDDAYSFSLPPASKVHKQLTGKQHETLLASAAFMESPFALGTAIDTWMYKITGEEKYKTSRRERLAEYSLGLQLGLKEGDYVGRVLTSPAMVSGVYVPLATVGAGYALSGVSAEASLLAGKFSSAFPTTAKVLSTVGKPLTLTGKFLSTKAGQIVTVGALYGVLEAPQLMEIAREQPERLPSAVGESVFSWGMAIAGFKAGGQAWTQKHTGSYKWDWKKEKMRWTPYEIPTKEHVIGAAPDVVEFRYPQDKTFFTAESKQFTEGGRQFDIWLKGVGQKMPGEKTVFTEAVGSVSWVEKQGFKKLGKTVFFRMYGSGLQIGDLGETKVVFSKAFTEPIRQFGNIFSKGRGVSFVRAGKPLSLKGDIVFEGEKIPLDVFPELSGVGPYSYVYVGKYKTPWTYGAQLDVGRVYSFDIGGDPLLKPARGVDVSGLTSRVDYGKLFAEVKQITSKIPPSPKVGGKPILLAPPEIKSSVGVTKPVSLSVGRTEELVSVSRPDVGLWSGMQPLSLSITDTVQRQKKRQRVKYGLKTEQITKQRTEQEYGLGFITETGLVLKPVREGLFDFLPVSVMALELGSLQRQAQRVGLKSDLVLDFAPEYDLSVTTATPASPVPPVPIIPVPPVLPLGGEDDILRRRWKPGVKRKPESKSRRGILEKGLLSDLLSVTKSYGRFGRATHPKLTRKVWKRAEKGLFMRVPTVELFEEGQRRRKKRGKKYKKTSKKKVKGKKKNIRRKKDEFF